MTSPIFPKHPALSSGSCDASAAPLGSVARRLIAIRIDPLVLAAVRREAKRRALGYQSLINQILARHVARARSA